MNERERIETPAQEEGLLHGWRVVYARTATGWCAYAPDLPTIIGAAATREEVEQQMDEAIPLHLEALREDRAQRPWLYTPEKLSPELRAVFERIDSMR